MTASRYHPRRWTALTWLAVLLWAWRPFVHNFPPYESYTVDPVTRELSEPTRYRSLAELPFPVGWPLYYVKPSWLTAPPPLLPVGAPALPPAPSTVHPLALITNLVLVVLAISALVYILQKAAYRFSLLFLLGVMAAVPLYFALPRLLVMFGGLHAARWYSTIVYFSPVPIALAVRYSIFPRLKWPPVSRFWKRGQPASSTYHNAEDAIAAASRLEMRGDWSASIELYRQASERWPEHAEYVQSCIDRVAAKQSLLHQ